MTLRAPAWLQNGESYSAGTDRLTVFDMAIEHPGVVDPSHMRVVPTTPASMNLTITDGHAIVKGSIAGQGSYSIANDGNASVTVTTADSSNGRIDLVVLTVRDSDAVGNQNEALFQVIAGTPAATPAPPAVPINSIVLARVVVGRGQGAINAGNIQNQHRQRAMLRRSLGASIFPVSSDEELNLLVANYRSSISATNPLVVFRTNVTAGRQLQYTTNGSTFIPVNNASDPNNVTLFGAGASLVGGSAGNANGFLMQAGTTAHRSNQYGNAEIRFPRAFPNGVLSVVVTHGHHAARGTLHFDLAPTNPGDGNKSYPLANKHSFLYRVHDAQGRVKANIQHRLNWIAVGW